MTRAYTYLRGWMGKIPHGLKNTTSMSGTAMPRFWVPKALQDLRTQSRAGDLPSTIVVVTATLLCAV